MRLEARERERERKRAQHNTTTTCDREKHTQRHTGRRSEMREMLSVPLLSFNVESSERVDQKRETRASLCCRSLTSRATPDFPLLVRLCTHTHTHTHTHAESVYV